MRRMAVTATLGLLLTASLSGCGHAALTSLDAGSRRYVQVGDVVLAISGGQVQASYPLPVLNADPTAGSKPKGYKALFTGNGVGEVTGLVPMASGDVLALSSTGFASAVTDLMTGHTVLLKGYGSLGRTVRTNDGDLLVLAWRANDQSFPMRVLLLNGSTFQPASVMSTGIAPVNYLHDDMILGTGRDAVLSVASGTEAAGVSLKVFSITGTRLTAEPPLPLNAGLDIAPALNGQVYVYGGPRRIPLACSIQLAERCSSMFRPCARPLGRTWSESWAEAEPVRNQAR